MCGRRPAKARLPFHMRQGLWVEVLISTQLGLSAPCKGPVQPSAKSSGRNTRLLHLKYLRIAALSRKQPQIKPQSIHEFSFLDSSLCSKTSDPKRNSVKDFIITFLSS